MTIAQDALDALQAGAKGALAGAAFGPIGAGIGGAVELASTLLPGVAHLFAGDAGTAAKVVGVVQAVTGTADPEAQAVAATDPQVAADLRGQLAQIAAERQAATEQAQVDALKAGLADVAGARAQQLALVQTSSLQSWAAPVVSVVVAIGFFATLTSLTYFGRPLDPLVASIVNILVGTLVGGFSQVCNYWLGSSAGSASKDVRLANSVPASLMPQPAAVVPAADVRKS